MRGLVLWAALAAAACGGGGEPDTQAPTAPDGGSAREAQPSADAEPEPESKAETEQLWRRYVDPISGVSFLRPWDWTVTPRSGAVVVESIDHREGRELITISALDAASEEGVTAPSIAEELDRIVADSFPGLTRRSGPDEVEDVPFGAASYEYRGQVSAKRVMRLRVYVADLGGRIVSLQLLADRTTFRRRRDDVARIFASFEAAHGGAMAASSGESVMSLDPRIEGRFAGEGEARAYHFGQDGTVVLGPESELDALRDGTDPGATLQRGRWTSRGGILRLAWSGGGMDAYRYRVTPEGAIELGDLLSAKTAMTLLPVR